jgi:hypothetical protein
VPYLEGSPRRIAPVTRLSWSSMSARTMQEMARVRFGQARAWPFIPDGRLYHKLRGQRWQKAISEKNTNAPGPFQPGCGPWSPPVPES